MLFALASVIVLLIGLFASSIPMGEKCFVTSIILALLAIADNLGYD
jgi:hypothetical protein